MKTRVLLRQKPGRASVFEELIHATQFRKGLNDGSAISRLKNEIAAQKKLLKYCDAYKLTPLEIKQTKAALESYTKELEKLLGGNIKMYKVSQKFAIGTKYSISVEGDVTLLKNGSKLKDENGNIFIIESIGMVNYRDRESINNYTKHAEIILKGDIKTLGGSLEIVEC